MNLKIKLFTNLKKQIELGITANYQFKIKNFMIILIINKMKINNKKFKVCIINYQNRKNINN